MSMQIEIREHNELPARVARLLEVGLAEGFSFVRRFVAEWEAGLNRFGGPGEVSLFAYLDGELVGFGGLNVDPYQSEPSVGRVRHVYVDPTVRGRGVGAALVRELVRGARPAFATLRLSAEQAAPFYEHLGFAPVTEPKATHKLALRPGVAPGRPPAPRMESWPVLPAAPLAAPGPETEACRQRGCATYRDVARALHELPYGRNSDRGDFRLVWPEGRGTCSTKHALLAAVAREQDLPVALRIGIYDMAETNTPGVGRLLSSHGLPSLPEAHCYLAYADLRVDITRAGVLPEAAIGAFHEEWSIEPAQIGAPKVALHQRYLRAWLRERRDLDLSFEELWAIREACIRELGTAR